MCTSPALEAADTHKRREKSRKDRAMMFSGNGAIASRFGPALVVGLRLISG